MPARCPQTLQGWGRFLQNAVYALNQCSIYIADSLTIKIHGSRNQGIEMGVTPLTITTRDPLGKVLPPLFTTLCSASLEVLIPEVGMLLPGDTIKIPMN